MIQIKINQRIKPKLKKWSSSNDESTEKIEQIKPELEKKYTEDEAKKMANEYAKKVL